ncbi:HEAT repeat domain-containing protein [candidate division WS5 bacterium]|uniref:HEAT repeat domain-containing protein n=1 Tax=candidate division WS5 bacterium TaxID=2093353 RepID=A0A419DEX7_9BACT|nr:MAG: HEAT repeat domain-containing protein [candidate division WS5 bacterium]
MRSSKVILIVIACLSFQFIACVGWQVEYESARRADTIEAYEKFINKYPNPSNEIIHRHKELKDKEDYRFAEKINTTNAYQEFVQNHPDNLYVEDALERLSEPDKDAYTRTLLIGTDQALEGYIGSYPSSTYRSDAIERIAWISDQNKHIANVKVDVRNLDFIESYAMKKKILNMLNNGLADTGIYMESAKIAGADDHVMDISIEYVDDPPPAPTVGGLMPIMTGGGVVPAVVGALAGILIDEMLDYKSITSRKKIVTGYKIKISYGDDSSFDAGYYYLDEYDPSLFIKLHDVIIWLKESESLPLNSLYAVMGIPDSSLRDETSRALSSAKYFSDQLFVTVLNNDDWKVRESAVKVLSYREDESLMHYIKPLARDSNYWVRIAVLKALLRYEYEGSSELFIDALSDENEIVREAAVIVQRIVKDKRAVPQLINRLRDPSKEVRAEAAWALKEIGDKSAVGALIETIDDKEILVRIRVESALESITGQKFGEDIEKWKKWLEENGGTS